MLWLKRNIWKAGIAVAGLLLVLVLMMRVPVSSASTSARASGLAIARPVQATPTVDATVTALNKEKLQHENDWGWSYGATILSSVFSTLVLVGGALIGFWQWRMNRNDTRTKESKDRQEAQDKDLRAQAEERFKTAVTALGNENEATQVGGAILLRSFLNPSDENIYRRYYIQIFDLAVAYLSTSNLSRPSEDPDGLPPTPVDTTTPLPLTPLRKALAIVFKEAFPLARKNLPHINLKFEIIALNASSIRLDGAYIPLSDFNNIWMRGASLREANLINVKFRDAALTLSDMSKANLSFAKLNNASLIRANLYGADLEEADLSGANLTSANLEEARSLKDTDLRGVKGLTKEQLQACKAKGAIIDEDTTTSASQLSVSPPLSTQGNDAQTPSVSPAQVNTPTPSTDGSSGTSSQPSTEP